MDGRRERGRGRERGRKREEWVIPCRARSVAEKHLKKLMEILNSERHCEQGYLSYNNMHPLRTLM
jgi:hypothetical protein